MNPPDISGQIWLGVAAFGVVCLLMGLFKHFLVLVACAYVMVWGVADHNRALAFGGLIGVVAIAIAGSRKAS